MPTKKSKLAGLMRHVRCPTAREWRYWLASQDADPVGETDSSGRECWDYKGTEVWIPTKARSRTLVVDTEMALETIAAADDRDTLDVWEDVVKP